MPVLLSVNAQTTYYFSQSLEQVLLFTKDKFWQLKDMITGLFQQISLMYVLSATGGMVAVFLESPD